VTRVHVLCASCSKALWRQVAERYPEAEEWIDGLEARCCGCGVYVVKWWRLTQCAPTWTFDRCGEIHG